jgi:hypothetical protein
MAYGSESGRYGDRQDGGRAALNELIPCLIIFVVTIVALMRGITVQVPPFDLRDELSRIADENTARVNHWLNEFRYKPGWTFTYDGSMLIANVDAVLPDGSKTFRNTITTFLPNDVPVAVTTEMMSQSMKTLITRLETRIMREWVTHRGEQIWTPEF